MATATAPVILRRAVKALSLPHHNQHHHHVSHMKQLSFCNTPRFSVLTPQHRQSVQDTDSMSNVACIIETGLNNVLRTIRKFSLVSPLYTICHLAEAVKGNTTEHLLNGVMDKSTIEEVKEILEMANRAALRKIVLHTDFLTPPVLKESMLVLEKLADVKVFAQGGYPQAERCRISVGHVETLTSDPDIVAALSITGNFKFEPYSHGDFLGSILGTGITRGKLGDILLQGEEGAQIFVVAELVDYIISTLDKIGSIPVSCTRIPLEAVEYEPPRTQSFRSVEASVRVDALASAGFKISRSKLTTLISKGDVRVNWSTITKNGTILKTGDVVSVTGKGRLKIGEIIATKKGKFSVELIRYI